MQNHSPDVLCLQEIKARPEQLDDFQWAEGWQIFWNPAEKPGYSGTAVLTKEAPIAVRNGIGIADHDREGRVITLEFPEYFLVNVYVPNSQRELTRLEYRTKKWEPDFLAYLKTLERTKPVVVCGDFNVAHQEIDLARPKQNTGNAGFTPEERACMQNLLASGFVDTFRLFESGGGFYTWWSYQSQARARNIGWRIDYFLSSASLRGTIRSAAVHPEVPGSDHCPVSLRF